MSSIPPDLPGTGLFGMFASKQKAIEGAGPATASAQSEGSGPMEVHDDDHAISEQAGSDKTTMPGTMPDKPRSKSKKKGVKKTLLGSTRGSEGSKPTSRASTRRALPPAAAEVLYEQLRPVGSSVETAAKAAKAAIEGIPSPEVFHLAPEPTTIDPSAAPITVADMNKILSEMKGEAQHVWNLIHQQ